MAISLKDKNILIYDYGNYFPVCERMNRADGFGKVFYFCPIVYTGFPDHRPLDIGRNVPDVEKVNEWASVIDSIDIIMFTEAHEPALQCFFEDTLKKKVFGSRYACELEHDRARTKEILKEVGLPVGDYEVAHGMDELEQILKVVENVWVKSMLRGEMESWHHENYLLSKGELLRMRNHLGAYANKETYVIESALDKVAEIGIETYSVDGLYPSDCLADIEIKDTGCYGQIVPYHSLPRPLKAATDKLSDVFRDLHYCGGHSNEVIITSDKKGYLTDLTQRLPQPPTDLMLEMFNNYPQIIWDVANGVVPQIQYTYKHGVQLIIKSELAKTEPCPILIPDEFKRFVKIKNLVIDDDGTYYFTPQQGIEMCEIGSCVGLGQTMYEAIGMAKKVAESIKGFDIKINTDCIEDAMKQIRALKQIGINYLT